MDNIKKYRKHRIEKLRRNMQKIVNQVKYIRDLDIRAAKLQTGGVGTDGGDGSVGPSAAGAPAGPPTGQPTDNYWNGPIPGIIGPSIAANSSVKINGEEPDKWRDSQQVAIDTTVDILKNKYRLLINQMNGALERLANRCNNINIRVDNLENNTERMVETMDQNIRELVDVAPGPPDGPGVDPSI